MDGSDPKAAAAAAKGADMAVVFAWAWRTEAQDPESMALPDNQDALIDAVAGANRKTLVVVEAGGPVLMPWVNRVPAILHAWYPGQRGGEAIANILFGDVDPSGRLPITFPASIAQAPRPQPLGLAELHAADARRSAGDKTVYGMSGGVAPFPVDYPEGADVGYRWYAARNEKPLFPFGHGLTYTSFRYAGLKVTDGARLTVEFDVTNSGKREGADVPQLYVEAKSAAGTRAYRLAGFEGLAQARRDPPRLADRRSARYRPLRQCGAGLGSRCRHIFAAHRPFRRRRRPGRFCPPRPDDGKAVIADAA